MEHVPPKCLFPKKGDVPDYERHRTNLFTVPSCKKHNMEKSGDDEYLWYLLSCCISANDIAKAIVQGRLRRAVDRKPKLMASFIAGATPVMLRDTITGEEFDSGAIEVDRSRLELILKHVARGVYFAHYRKRWDGPLRVIPHFLNQVGGRDAARINDTLSLLHEKQKEFFQGVEYRGENPEVFSYQIVEPDSGGPIRVAASIHFYGGCNVTALYGASAPNA